MNGRFQLRFLALLMLAFCLPLSVAHGQEYADEESECLLNRDALEKPAFFSNQEFISAKWDDKKKTGVLRTRHGETLTITLMACENLGQDVYLTVKAGKPGMSGQKWIKQRARWLALLVLGKGKAKELGSLDAQLEGDAFQKHFRKNGQYDGKPFEADLKSDYYSEAYLTINSIKGELIFSLYTIAPG